MPSYLGPSPFQLGHLFTTLIVNSITLFALGILLIRNVWCLAVNTTTIEGWEIERHRTLLRRARHFGGYLEGADGSQVRIKKQEFPYDIGIWANIVQGMAPTPSLQTGLSFPTNGFEDAGTTWPPPDPDRSYRRHAKAFNTDAFTYQDSNLGPQQTLNAFKARQAEDEVRRRKPFLERAEASLAKQRVEDWNGVGGEEDGYEYGDEASDVDDETREKYEDGEGQGGEEGWRNSEGERLQDFGVDEDVEFYDEHDDDDEVPLSELLARKQAASASVYMTK
ncbi:Palmitoyltransferase [Neocucurbitaria cava]|uniref:Palmitoyltransferase n=1 Tax=Neocucurbitaria cava TaxID=798079 RepID=A0A9W8YDA1_9PLEO|nr:Palmitoyltransferase [Neocucurbitaria cava]